MNLALSTKNPRQVIDITPFVEKELKKVKLESGLCNIFVKHTTCGVTTADLDPGTDLDFLEFLEEITPDLDWRHPHDPEHVPDHILSSIIGPSVSVPFKNGKILLGNWQRIVMVEFSGPKDRELELSFIETK
jgi:secondary thiamine-phosphate synthase enzyme